MFEALVTANLGSAQLRFPQTPTRLACASRELEDVTLVLSVPNAVCMRPDDREFVRVIRSSLNKAI